ncbi:hypothetical protein GCM10023222_04350 [Saccharopolyspora cebuensis]
MRGAGTSALDAREHPVATSTASPAHSATNRLSTTALPDPNFTRSSELNKIRISPGTVSARPPAAGRPAKRGGPTLPSPVRELSEGHPCPSNLGKGAPHLVNAV